MKYGGECCEPGSTRPVSARVGCVWRACERRSGAGQPRAGGYSTDSLTETTVLRLTSRTPRWMAPPSGKAKW